jgi:hypothetical protein
MCADEKGVNIVYSEEFGVYNESYAVFPEHLAFGNNDINRRKIHPTPRVPIYGALRAVPRSGPFLA